ncbi:MAG: Fic family protein [Candidatus Diapherotrites archaeon]
MGKIIERTVKGNKYYYLGKSYRIGKKVRKVRLYLGRTKPSETEFKKKEKELQEKVKQTLTSLYDKILDQYQFYILSRKELAGVEQVKDNFISRFQKLSKKQREEYDKNQVVHFVFTTLRTEGVDVDYADVETAFEIIDKRKKKLTMDSKVIISSSMITGFNYLPSIQWNKKDILRLHGIVMTTFEDKSPGQLRDDQRIIARFNPLTMKSEEIDYRPPAPAKVEKELDTFFVWLDKNKNIHPLELAGLVHLKLYLIHPFKDGNKRMCRLLFNKVLQDAGYPILNISKNTAAYFKELIRSVESGNESFFVKFCYEEFLSQIKHRRLN